MRESTHNAYLLGDEQRALGIRHSFSIKEQKIYILFMCIIYEWYYLLTTSGSKRKSKTGSYDLEYSTSEIFTIFFTRALSSFSNSIFFFLQRSKIKLVSRQLTGEWFERSPSYPQLPLRLYYFLIPLVFSHPSLKKTKTGKRRLSPGVCDRHSEFCSRFYWKCKLLIKKHSSVYRLPGGILFTLLLRGFFFFFLFF